MLTNGIGVSVAEDAATITYDNDDCRAMAGTTRSLLANMVKGVQRVGKSGCCSTALVIVQRPQVSQST